MKAKAKRALKHLEKIKVAKWAVNALRDYHGLCEELITEAHDDAMKERKLGEKRKKILDMLGIRISPMITDKTVNFVYNNVKELRKGNKDISLMTALFNLQMQFEDLEFYCKLLDCDIPPLNTVDDVKKLREKLKKKYLDYEVRGYDMEDYGVPEA